MAKGIRDKVAIVGMGCTYFGEKWDQSATDMMITAAYEAYEDAGIQPKDIQAAWVGTTQAGVRGTVLSAPLKLQYIPITRIENACATGTDAFRNACYGVASGAYDIALALGVEKIKDTGYSGLETSLSRHKAQDTWVDPEVFMGMPAQFAMAATRYFHRYGLSPQDGKMTLAKISVKNHHNGTLAPKAHLHREITLEQVMNAPMFAWPLGLFDCCGVSDGSAAAIVTTPEIAKKLRKDYVLVKGLGVACGADQAQLQDDYDFTHFEETVMAAKLAYAEAGITNPREQVSMASVHDCFSITELINYEDLGFSPHGKGKEDVDSGFFALDGKLPVNTDGGLKCFGHPVGASGLRMIYELYKQLQGKADKRQLKDPKFGVSHNLGGIPGRFTCAVCVLGKQD
ncbi:MAG: acetyl-CoA acetyltransferase [Dehalococcoidia bacterium]|nr:acetyl-CoA acetyltransferase [Dehalococcoidia bacterium]